MVSPPFPPGMTLPKVDLSWMRPSEKVLNPKRGGRNAAISTSTISTATSRPTRYDDLFSPPRHPSSTAVGIRRPAAVSIPYRSGINSHAHMVPPQDPDPPKVKILYVLYFPAHRRYTYQLTSLPADSVMGATGSGKSTVCYASGVLPRKLTLGMTQFINLASGSSLDVGRGLQSCTNAVQVVKAFNLDGRRVVLIDTPGFNDTTKSDTEILRTIVAFLGAS